MSCGDAESLDRDLASILRTLREEADETLTRWDHLTGSTPPENDTASDARLAALDVRYEKAFETDVTERVAESLRAAAIERPAVLHRHI